MNYQELQAQFRGYKVFSLHDIRQWGRTFYRPRLSEWQKKGYIRKIVNGFYAFTDDPTDEKSLFHIAGRIYRPSYVSLEMAFSFYHLVPESVYAITSISTRCTRSFKTPLGTFSYRTVRPELFWGYQILQEGMHSFNMADPEKAFLDYLYLHNDLRQPKDFEDLRLDVKRWLELWDEKRFGAYRERFRSKTIDQRAGAFSAFLKHA